MHPARRSRLPQACAAGLLLLLIVGFSTAADAHTRRHRNRNRVMVALQPFLAARSAIHAVADPVVFNAPRVAIALATAPVRVAYQTARPAPIYHGERVDEDEIAAPDEEAYYTSRVRRPQPPHRERAESLEDEDEDDGPRQAAAEPDNSKLRGGSRPMVRGSRALLRSGVAYAPSNAPQRVKDAIWATNSLRRKPYVWGGGHGSFDDRGYDCSGTVSFALHHAGALGAPLPSSDFMRFGERGRGRWFTIYTRPGHTFAVIAGLRLDTTDFNRGGNVGPRWHEDGRETFGYVARHPAGM